MAAQNTTPIYHKQPYFLSSSDQLKTYTKLFYNFVISKSVYLFIIPAILCSPIHHLSAVYFDQTTITDQLHKYYANAHCSFIIGFVSLSSLLMGTIYILTTIMRRPRKVYLVDFACYKHDPSFLISRDSICRRMENVISPESIEFCRKVMEKSGVSDDLFVYGCNDFPQKSAFDCGLGEAETVISGAVGDLLAKTRVNPRDIGVVIVNISTFNPVPSLSAMIVNRYKLREDVLSYSLGGMGCSAGVIAVDLAKWLLQVRLNTYALVVSLESPTSNLYVGNDRSKLMSNCLFRMGGAALLLSNRSSDYQLSKYELKHTVRTHHGADNKAYTCALQGVDNEGKLGISISKDLPGVAGKALKANIATLGPLVLPISEQLLFLAKQYEAKGRIQKGDRIWQIAFGTGFKCGSLVWRALRTTDPARADNPWSDVIDQFPINTSN
ncbi:UNVERIFIED_CONTAM: 3-ketoacyl-CoA synthase 20 [Sesamum radiatum]|uniref:3-ketoacyl-CoA synthase n=1 Tax=Sesamum radiatum TaxID=300843 RepID=A0AAW2KPJ4_SESRA